jgi:hypothetical protein
MSARRLLLIAVAATLVALTVACSGDSDDGPSTLPSVPSDSALPSPSATAATPGTSSETTLDSESAAQVEALVREWWASVDEAGQTGQPDLLTPLFAPQCLPCSRYQSTVAELVGAGERIDGGNHLVTAISVGPNAVDTVLVNVTVDIEPSEVLDEAGTVVRNFDGASGVNYVFNLASVEEGQWRVFDIITP